MSRLHTWQSLVIAIGFLAVPVIVISVIPEQNSPALNTGISRPDSSRSEGDSNPQPVATVTRYASAPVKRNSGTCKVSLVIGPSPAIPAPTSPATPYVPVYGLAHTHSVQAEIPCPKEPDTETPTSTK